MHSHHMLQKKLFSHTQQAKQYDKHLYKRVSTYNNIYNSTLPTRPNKKTNKNQSQQALSFIRRISTIAISIASILFITQTANAQQAVLQEVIVNAQKRAENLQDVPISANVLSGDIINNTGTANLEDLSSFVPNFTINQTGISTTISIRGISSGINQGFEQSVGTYVDGVYYGRAQLARAPLLDLASVEVLRGPQTILFGKNSIAGAVNLATAKPSNQTSASLTALYEPDHGEKDIRLVLNGALTDTLSGRLALMRRTFDGYYTNTITGDDEPNQESTVVRATFNWQATDNINALLKLEQSSFDVLGRNIEVINDTAAETGFGFSTIYPAITGGGTFDATQDFKRQANGDRSDNDVDNITLTVEYALDENTLTSVTGFSAYEYDELCDCDFTGANTLTLGLTEEYDQFSQEIRITSPTDQTLSYIAGLFYQTSELNFQDDFRISGVSALTGLPSVGSALAGYNTVKSFDQDSDLWAVFAQATWHLNETMRLTLGGRFSDEDKSAKRSAVSSTTAANPIVAPGGITLLDFAENALRAEPHQLSGKRSETAFTPLANFQLDINEDMMFYATYTEGYKSGGFDVRSNASPDINVGIPAAITDANPALLPSPVGVFEFEEEEAQSIELGLKSSLLNGTAELNVAAYRTNYDDLQVSIFDGGLGFNVGNAAKAKVQGLELDGRWRASEALSFSASLAYLDFEFEDYKNGECYFRQEELEPNTVTNAALSTCSFDGKRQVYTPEWTANLAADYNRQLNNGFELRANVNISYSDEYLASPSLDPRATQDAYTKVGARIAITAEDEQWEIALIGKNLTDETVTVYAAELPASGTLVAGVTGGQQGLAYYGFYDRPRSIALQGKINF